MSGHSVAASLAHLFASAMDRPTPWRNARRKTRFTKVCRSPACGEKHKQRGDWCGLDCVAFHRQSQGSCLGTSRMKRAYRDGLSLLVRMRDEYHGNKALEDGDPCRHPTCPGLVGLEDVVGCSCFISAPCSACEDNPLVCQECGEVYEA